jgi:arylsulfatase A-like enzyme
VLTDLPFNVLLVTIDALRADHVGRRGDGRTLTPQLDALASDGVRFTKACSHTCYTWGAFASIFMSAYPASVTDRRGMLVSTRPTLAECLQEAGYATAGFNSNPFISAGFGYARGFDLLDDGLAVPSGWAPMGLYPLLAKAQRVFMRQPYLSATTINRKAMQWLGRKRDGRRPFFLWVHYMDVHGPYQSKTGWTYLNKYRAELLWRKALSAPQDITPHEHEELLRCYSEEVAYTDRHVGLLLQSLRDMHLDDNTIVVVCADHGDEFREHGRYSHWRQLYDELIRVPLIIRHPQGRRGLVVDVPVGLVDITPTLVDSLGLGVESSELVGQTLWPVVREGNGEGLRGYVVGDAAPDRDQTLIAIRTDRWKLITDSSKDARELYDLDHDPGERVNVIDQQPRLAMELSAQLQRELGRGLVEALVSENRPGWSAAEEAEVIARLKALGYVEWVEDHGGH